MARDPLDTALLVMLDQAKSVRDQLRAHAPAREALDAISESADALADRVDAAYEASMAAHLQSTLAQRKVPRARGAGLAVAGHGRDWLARLDLRLRLASRTKDLVVRAAVRTVRSRMPKERRRYRGMRVGVIDVVPVLELERAALGPSVGPLVDEGLGLVADFNRVQASLDAAVVASAAAVARSATQRLVLLAALREARLLWTAAADASDKPVGALDLRICAAAVAGVEVRKVRRADATAPEAGALVEAAD